MWVVGKRYRFVLAILETLQTNIGHVYNKSSMEEIIDEI